MTITAPTRETAAFAEQLETPCALVEIPILERNLVRLADAAAAAGVAVRPHVKTHKCPSIAARQIELGAVGITCATLGEATGMVDGGIEDVLVYYPIVGELATARFLALTERANVSTTVENTAGADQLDASARRHGIELDVLIDVDTGLGRTGVPIDGVEQLARHVESKPALNLRGIATHEGFSYRLRDPAERSQVVGERLSEFAAAGQRLGVEVVSCGSTPSLAEAFRTDGITEIRPGNYAFLDRMQIDLGLAGQDDCAFTVLSTVISVRDAEHAIVDAGSKALGSDRGVHGAAGMEGHGLIRSHPEMTLPAMSEEHGFLRTNGDSSVEVGDRLRIIPNHSCATAANFGALTFVDGGGVALSERLAGRHGPAVDG